MIIRLYDTDILVFEVFSVCIRDEGRLVLVLAWAGNSPTITIPDTGIPDTGIPDTDIPHTRIQLASSSHPAL